MSITSAPRGSAASGLRRAGTGSCALAAILFGASTPAASVIARDTPARVLAGRRIAA
jgi:hypothetical protein